MLSNEDIEKLTVSKKTKLEALVDVLRKLEVAQGILDDAIYLHMPMPMSKSDEWQDEANKYFWNSEGMKEIEDLTIALNRARDLAKHAVHILEDTTEAQATYYRSYFV